MIVSMTVSVLGIVGNLAGYGLVGVSVFGTGQLAGQAPSPDSVLTAIGLLVTLAQSIQGVPELLAQTAVLAGFTHRVGQAMEQIEALRQVYDKFEVAHPVQPSPRAVVARDVSCCTPTGAQLFDHLFMRVAAGTSMLIMVGSFFVVATVVHGG